MSVVSEGLPVISFGEECGAQISVSSAFSRLVTWVTCKQSKGYLTGHGTRCASDAPVGEPASEQTHPYV